MTPSIKMRILIECVSYDFIKKVYFTMNHPVTTTTLTWPNVY